MDNASIDLSEFEMAIRADERVKIKREIRERKAARMVEKRGRMEMIKRYAIQRISGFILAAGSIAAVAAGWTYDAYTQTNDATFLLVTVPLGLYMMFTKELCYNN